MESQLANPALPLAGRARVSARREPVCVVDLTECSIGSAVDSENNPAAARRGRDPSPGRYLNHNRSPQCGGASTASRHTPNARPELDLQ
jgi:hypothetical protein